MKYKLDGLNERLVEKIRSGEFRNRIIKITKRHPFFVQEALKHFSFVVVADETEDLNEPKFGCVMRLSRFYWQIKSLDDFVAHFLHTSLHECCEHEWYRVSTPKDTFTPIELDVLEEIYSQFVIYKINPEIHDWFPNSIRRYLEFIGVEENKVTDQIFFLLENNDTSSDFRRFIISLYSAPLEVGTFAEYISKCESLLLPFGLRKLIQEYDDLLNGITNESD